MLVKSVPNPMVEDGRENTWCEHVPGETIGFYAPPEYATDENAVCVWRGEAVPYAEWETVRPCPDDELMFSRDMQGLETLTLLIVSVALSAISYAVNRSNLPKADKLLPDADQKVYSFSGIRTTAESGAPIPFLYGRHAIGGNVLAHSVDGTLISSDPDEDFPVQSRLNVLLGLCEGEICAVESIKLNANDISTYDQPGPGALVTQTRMGTVDQGPLTIPGFAGETRTSIFVGEDLVNPTDQEGASGTEFEDQVIVERTTQQEVDRVRINILHTGGLFGINSSGSYPVTVKWDVRYRKVGDPTWTAFETFSRTANVRSAFVSTCVVDLPERAQYDVQVRRRTPESPTIYTTDIRWDSLIEVLTETYSYPNTALLGVSVAASSNLQGSSVGNYEVTVLGRKVEYWDDVADEWVESSIEGVVRNPAWIVIDYLTSPRGGLGSKLTKEKNFEPVADIWKAFADYCDERVPNGKGGLEDRHRCDVVIEGNEGAWSTVIRILANCRAYPVRSGDTYKVVWQREGRPVVWHFGNRKIIRETFKKVEQSTKRRATRVDVRFLNDARGYQSDSVPALDPELVSKQLPLVTTSVDGFGITRESEAARRGKYELQSGRIKTFVTFESALEGIPVEVGDLVGVSHELPGWGLSGAVRDLAADSITLDQDVQLAAGASYQVGVVHKDGTYIIRDIASPAGFYPSGTPILVDEDWTLLPEIGNHYSIGEPDQLERIIEITRVRLSEALTVEIQGFVYDERILDDSVDPVDPVVITQLPDPYSAPACLDEAPTLTERLDGTTVLIDVSWSYTEDPNVTGARVWIRRIDPTPITGWQFVGEVDSPETFFTIGGIEGGVTYEVSVLQVSALGAMRNPNNCVRATIEVDGLGPVLDAPTNLAVVQVGEQLQVSWSPVPGAVSYEVRRGQEWVLSRAVGDTTSTSILTSLWAPTGSGDQPGVERFRVRAISATNLYGREAVLETALNSWYQSINLVDRDEFTLLWPGTKTNLQSATGGFLELTDRALPGTYESPEFDLGSLQTYRIGAVVWGLMDDGPPVSGVTYTGSSTQAKTTGAHGPIDPAEWLGTLSVEFRVADAQAGLASATYTPLLTLPIAARWVQLRVTVATSDTSWSPRLDYLFFSAEVVP